jgi:Fe-S-cluster-containing dehydrogenase component
VIDQDSCVRCGHCAWSCADTHDGISRLIRRGDKVVTQLAESGRSTGASLLLPNTCQHCRHAACMIDCPTGAIGRDPLGEVFIHASLCTGCGNCAKACPWDNIQLAPRPNAEAVKKGASSAGTTSTRAIPPATREAPDDTASSAGTTATREVAKGVVGFPDLNAEARRSGVRGKMFSTRREDPVETALSPQIAVKCDLCRGYEAPACVEACPTGAVLRLDPSRDVADVARVFGWMEQAPAGVAPRAPVRKRAIGSLGVTLAIVAAAAAVAGHRRYTWTPAHGVGLAAGVVAAVLVVALAAYVLPKRRPRLRRADPARRLVGEMPPVPRSRTRVHFLAHLALGGLLPAAVLAHAGTAVGSTLAVTLAIAVLLGALGALAYRLVPRALTRLERRGALPEDLAGERETLEVQLYRAVSGSGDRLKALADHVVLPYARARLGAVALVASGRDLAAEQARLRARVDRVLAGRVVDGVDPLLRIAVELRALPARALLGGALRAVVPLHVIAGAMTVGLLVVHVAMAVMR